jgi:hypothetical protein
VLTIKHTEDKVGNWQIRFRDFVPRQVMDKDPWIGI